MGESYYTSSYTDIKIHLAVKNIVLDKRNASHVAIMYFEPKENRNFSESSHLKRILFGLTVKNESFRFKAALLCVKPKCEDLLLIMNMLSSIPSDQKRGNEEI